MAIYRFEDIHSKLDRPTAWIWLMMDNPKGNPYDSITLRNPVIPCVCKLFPSFDAAFEAAEKEGFDPHRIDDIVTCFVFDAYGFRFVLTQFEFWTERDQQRQQRRRG